MPTPYVQPGTGLLVSNLSRLQYSWRFTLIEQIALRRALRSSASEDVRDTLDVLDISLARVEDDTGVDVTDPRTVDGAWYAVGVLAALGVVTNTEAAIAARVAEVLAPWVAP